MLHSTVTLASVSVSGEWVSDNSNLSYHVPTSVTNISDPNYRLLIVPGGPGATILTESATVLRLIHDHALVRKQPLAAIGSGISIVLAHNKSYPGVLNGTEVVWPSSLTAITDAGAKVNTSLPVLVNQGTYNLTTARGTGLAQEFALRLVGDLCGPIAAEYIANQTQITNPRYPMATPACLYPNSAKEYHTWTYVTAALSGACLILAFVFVFLFVRTKSSAYQAI
jgi:putative intracellular protease/amidase